MMGEGVYVCKYILHIHILTVVCVSIYIRTYVRISSKRMDGNMHHCMQGIRKLHYLSMHSKAKT